MQRLTVTHDGVMWYVWVHIEEGDPSTQTESMVIGSSSKSREMAFAAARMKINDLSDAARRLDNSYPAKTVRF